MLLSRTRLANVGALPNQAPTDIRVIGWLDEQLVSARRDGTVALLRYGIPRMWLGVNFECHDIVVSHNQAVSYGVRWHAEHPALLWEVQGASIALDAGATDPKWSSTATSGETLLAGFLP